LGAKVARLVLVLLLVSFFTMALLSLTPGDPAATILGPEATKAQVEHLNHELGLDQPLLQRYLHCLGDLLHGGFGTSIRTGQPALRTIMERLPVTLEIAILGLLMALLVAVPLGIYTAQHEGRAIDRGSQALCSFLVSVPGFFSALLLGYWLGVVV